MTKKNTPETFWARVSIGATEKECWLWQGRCGNDGYGDLMYQGAHMRSHRLAYLLTFGDIPKGMLICHKCDNPPCCNPVHLFLGTPKDNSGDMVSKGRSNAGERNPVSILTADQVKEIKSLHATGMSYGVLGTRYGVSRYTIRNIIKRGAWKHI